MKLGLNNEISNYDYHADREYISSSGLKLLLKNKRDYFKKYIQGKQEPSNPVFDFGTYIHDQILEDGANSHEFAIYNGAKRFGKLYDKFKEENSGKMILLKSEVEQAEKLVDSYKNNPIAKGFLATGVPEQTICAEIDNVKIKIRADWTADKYILDLKTTSYSLDKSSLESTIIRYDYDLSAALYMDIASKYLKKPIKEFYFMFANKKNYDIIIAKASDELIENGRKKYMRAIKKFKKLKEEGFFDLKELPSEDILILDLPEYGRVK